MWLLINEYKISTKIVDDLFDGVESDIQNLVKLNSKKELLIYSYRVAGTVGLMMAKILNVTSSDSLKSAIDLGIAMQLTNISRDVIEDSKNKRFYIKHDFETIKETLRIADLFYDSCFSSIKDIPLSLRFSILVAILLKNKPFKIITNQVKFLLLIVVRFYKQYYLYLTW
jgi:phytoene synthase